MVKLHKDKRKVKAWCPSSPKKLKFICLDCNHTTSMALHIIASGKLCGYCSGMCLCGELECYTCYEKSFAYHYPDKSLEWSSRNILRPYQVINASLHKFFFDCAICGHEYQMSLDKISNGKRKDCKYCGGTYI